MKRAMGNLLAIMLGLLATGLLLEGVLRFFPVNEGLRTQPVNAAFPLHHFQPDRTSTWSRFADFSLHNQVHANNYGFLNDQDYDPDAPLPLVAVIGDSFVEAAMLPYTQTLQARLAQAMQDKARVYSFAASGAPLSQYLAYSGYACTAFHAERLIIVVVGNDFDESLKRYADMPGFHYFEEQGDDLVLRLTDYAPSWTTRLARHSRLALYLFTNLRIQDLPGRLTQPSDATQATFAGQTRAEADEQRLTLSRRAVDAFLARLPEATGLATQDVLFVLDGVRPQLYQDGFPGNAEHSYFWKMREYFSRKAQDKGFRLVDMQPLLLEQYRSTGQRFEFERDAHWNSAGHALAAQAVLESGLLDAYR